MADPTAPIPSGPPPARACAFARSWHASLVLVLLLAPFASHAVTIPNMLVNGTVADADDVNQNFDALATSINLHEPDPDAHHVKTVDAGELAFGTLPDARLSANVSLLGSLVEEVELGFDPATQTELDGQIAVFNLHALDPSAHHLRYSDAEAIAAVGPHVASVDGLVGGTLTSDLTVDGLVASTVGGVRFPDASVQTTAFSPGLAAVIPNRLLVAPSGGDFTSIQAAIDSITPAPPIEFPWSGESDPWLIEIAPGTYAEDLEIARSGIHLRGAGIGATVLVPVSGPHIRLDPQLLDPEDPPPPGTVVAVKLSRLSLYDDPAQGNNILRGIDGTASRLTLEDMRIEGYRQAQVFLGSGSRLDVRRVELANGLQNEHAIEALGSDVFVTDSTMNAFAQDCAVQIESGRLEIRDSVLSTIDSAEDVCAINASRVVLSGNRLEKGLRVETGQDLQIVGNEIGAALQVTDVDSTRIVGNWIGANSGASVGPVISVTGGNAEIAANTVWGGPQRTVVIGDGSTLTGNWIQGAPGSNVVTNEGSASIVGNTIEGGAVGILDEGGARILGNQIDGATQGIDLSGATGPTQLIGNRITNTTGPEPAERWALDREIRVEIESPAGGTVGSLILDPDTGASVTAGGSTLTLSANGDVLLSAAGNLTLSGADVTLSATGALRVDANRIEGNATSDLELNAGTTLGLDAGGEVDVTSSTTVDVNGGLITLN